MSNFRASIDRIEKLRALRVRPAQPQDMSSEVDRQLRQAKASPSQLSAVSGSEWGGVIPADLRATIVSAALTRGVLNLKASDTSGAFALRRWLANGGLDAIKASRPEVRNVMVNG